MAAMGPFIRVAVQLGSRVRALLCKPSLYRGGVGGSSGVITVFFFKTTILDGHHGNRVRQEIVFTFGKGFKEEKKVKLPVIVGCGYY